MGGGATTVKVFFAIIYRSTKIEQNFSAEDEPLDKFESAKIGILGKLHEIELEQIGQCSVWPDWAIYRLLGEFLKSAVTRRYRKVDPWGIRIQFFGGNCDDVIGKKGLLNRLTNLSRYKNEILL